MTEQALLDKLRGRFIAFEGPDGSGKSTQLKRLVALCLQHDVPVCEVREPGGTPIGESIRQILLHTKDEMSLRCEMLLYMASRVQLVEQRIRPALARGELVIADRFVGSTYAYQGAAGGIPVAEIDAVAKVALQGTAPELVLIFDVDEETAARRTRGVVKKSGGKQAKVAGQVTLFDDRIEQRGQAFHANVRRGYHELAAREPGRHCLIDASKGPDEVWASLLRVLGERF
ncbi:MAG: dTMP kinase [Phycisphaerales bacterium]|nr:dTMP kinase [Phycisphaerales bacterium]